MATNVSAMMKEVAADIKGFLSDVESVVNDLKLMVQTAETMTANPDTCTVEKMKELSDDVRYLDKFLGNSPEGARIILDRMIDMIEADRELEREMLDAMAGVESD